MEVMAQQELWPPRWIEEHRTNGNGAGPGLQWRRYGRPGLLDAGRAQLHVSGSLSLGESAGGRPGW